MEWQPDVLPGFEQLELQLTADDEGPVVATLVRRAPTATPKQLIDKLPESAPESAFATEAKADIGADVLYIHGWVDYFHQKHLAAYFESHGFRFYALDLRKYGRSIREWQTPGFTDSLTLYDEDINAALAAIGHSPTGLDDAVEAEAVPSRDETESTLSGIIPQVPPGIIRTIIESARSGYSEAAATKPAPSPSSEYDDRPVAEPATTSNRRRLVLMGHSTGGLIASLWAHFNPGRADALVLNSPWLEFQTGNFGRRALEGPVKAQARIAPMSHLVNPDQGFYVKSISNQFDGEWEINPDWKPVVMWPPTAAWMAAIFRAQDRVSLGLDLNIPVLVLLSAKSTLPLRWTPELLETDQVITVDDVMARAPSLGNVVTTVRLDGALHDVTLSTAEVRAKLWQELTRWLNAYLPG